MTQDESFQSRIPDLSCFHSNSMTVDWVRRAAESNDEYTNTNTQKTQIQILIHIHKYSCSHSNSMTVDWVRRAAESNDE